MVRTTRNGGEILEKFQIHDRRWVVLCFHNPLYAVWNMDHDGDCTFGTFSGSLEDATRVYQDRVCEILDPGGGAIPRFTLPVGRQLDGYQPKG